MESSNPDNKGPYVPSGADIVPETSKGLNIAEVMKKHIDQLSERNKAVDGRLFVDIGKNDSRALISETPLIEGTDSYRMVVVGDGIMAICVSRADKKNFGKEQLAHSIKSAIDDASRQHFGDNQSGGYEGKPGSNDPQIKLGRLSIGQFDSSSYTFAEDYHDIKLVVNPSGELVSKMIQSTRDRFQQLSAEKAASTSQKSVIAEGLKQI